MDIKDAKAAAQRLYKKINFGGGPLQSYEISSMLTDTYEYLKIPFKPTSKDIKSYTQVLDFNQDGQVTLDDLQAKAIEFLCGGGVSNGTKSFSSIRKDIGQNSNSGFNGLIDEKSNLQTKETKFEESNNSNGSFPKSYIVKESLDRRPAFSQQAQRYIYQSDLIFNRYCSKRKTITKESAGGILKDTYQLLGRSGYEASNKDVEVWMNLCDSNNDGHVEYDEYNRFVVGSLQRSGLKVYK